MTKTMSSMAEIARVGGWGLRGLGYSYGVAERAVPILAWTEAAMGGAIRSIRLAEQAIIVSYAAPSLSVQVSADGARTVRGHGRHLIEIGPPTMDLVTVEARRTGQGCLALTGTIGSEFVPALANMLAHRQLSGLAVYRPEASEKLRWFVFGPGYVGAPALVDDAPPQAVQANVAPNPQSLEETWKDYVQEARSANEAYLGLVVWKAESPQPEGQAQNLIARAQKAWTEGVSTTLEDIAYLYQLETRAWAPTSERSRSQAGYGKF